jgi:transcriptional regulator with XRE-family HTH domain
LKDTDMSREPKSPPLGGLRERRLFRNFTQQEMADEIDVNQSHYRQMETGGVRLDVHRAKKLAEKLDCSIDELL